MRSKPITDYEGLYDIYEDGRVWSYHRNSWLKSSLASIGYPSVDLSKNGATKQFRVHRLIAQAFIENPSNLPWINHKNGIKTDNRINNLEWCTGRDNLVHALKTGLRKSPRGERHGMAKLTEKDVVKIRGSTMPNREIAENYGVSSSLIGQIKRKKKWAHIN